MSKYAPLGDYLRRQTGAVVPMTFAQIEKVVGTMLPDSQRYPAWWSNNPFNNVMTQIWLDAGFVTESIDIAKRKLVFRRVAAKASAGLDTGDRTLSVPPASPSPHALFGWLKGTALIPEGVDLTEPADPEWGKNAEGAM